MIRPFLRRHVVPWARRLPSFLQEPLREIWYACAPKIAATARHGDEAVYAAQRDNETARFDAQTDVHALPPIAHYWSDKYLRPELEAFGFSNPEQFFVVALERAWRETNERPARFISLGAGNCDAEVRIAQALRARGIIDFVIECLEPNRAMRLRGAALAREAGVEAHIDAIDGDFNFWRPQRTYAAVIANQSLHHAIELEGLFDAVAQAISDGGLFATSDMIGRNGHQRWPESLAIVREFWAELPAAYRYNLQLRRHEKNFRDWDCAREGFEGVRAQDILPLLIERFDFDFFFAHSNLIDPFIDRSFGPHFDVACERDRAFIDRVQARDEAEIFAGRLTPTHMLAVMRAQRSGEGARSCLTRRHLTPAFCVRRIAPSPSRAR
ncbi:MAG: class I SAM-dependent methyltransferase [Proteobacteria bacterium]|nr:class I SAM-dependent methyltransferase [Pseudomonadota bacterium]